MMTDTKLDTVVILGSAWSGHFNKAIAEAMQANIERVGMPAWDDNDQTLAKALQRELGVPDSGLSKTVNKLVAPDPTRPRLGSMI